MTLETVVKVQERFVEIAEIEKEIPLDRVAERVVPVQVLVPVYFEKIVEKFVEKEVKVPVEVLKKEVVVIPAVYISPQNEEAKAREALRDQQMQRFSEDLYSFCMHALENTPHGERPCR